MKILALLSFIAAIFNLVLGFYVYTKNTKERLNIIFLFYSIFTCLWSISEFFFRISINEISALFWVKICYIFWPFAIACYLELSLAYTKCCSTLYSRVHCVIRSIILYIPALIIAVFAFLPQNPLGFVIQKVPWGWYGNSNIKITVYTFFWGSSLAIFSWFLFVIYYLKINDKKKKKQILITVIGLFVPLLLGIVSNIIFPFLNIKIPELSTLGTLFTTVFLAYAIKKYNLFTLSPTKFADIIVSTMNDALFLVDNNKIIKTVNKAALNILNYREHELLESSIEMIYKQNLDPDLFEQEGFLKSKDGQEVPVLISRSSMFDKMKKKKGTILICRDIRIRKKAEEEKNKFEKQILINSKLVEIGSLAAGISQQIGSPIQEIEKNIDVLYDKFNKGDLYDNSSLDLLNQIDERIEKIKIVVQDLKEYASNKSE